MAWTAAHIHHFDRNLRLLGGNEDLPSALALQDDEWDSEQPIHPVRIDACPMVRH